MRPESPLGAAPPAARPAASLWRRFLHWPVRQIRRRLLFALLLPMGLVMVATLPLDFRMAVAPSTQAYDESLAIEALALAEQVRMVHGHASLVLAPQAEALLRANAGDAEYFAVFDAQGQRLAGDALLPFRPPHLGLDSDFVDLTVAALLPGGPPQRLRMVSLQRRWEDVDVVVQVAETRQRREAAERRVLAALVLPNLLVASVGALVVYIATRVTVAPIEQLADQLGRQSPDALAPLHIEGAPAEIDAVVQALDRLFARVRASILTQQRFHANVAHQLRTPLTGLRTQVELAAMDGHFEGNPAGLARITQALDRLSHLIDQLLVLARAEVGAIDGLRPVPVDMPALVEQAASDLLDQAIRANIDLGFELAATPSLRGAPLLLGEGLRNLVDNALRHCPPGSSVTVACGETGGHPWLAVEDDGPGIAPDQRDAVFERFRRGPSRAAEGSGLGLAIVREIADLHQARIQVSTPSTGRGVRFALHFQPGPQAVTEPRALGGRTGPI